jgi:osmotically-inducible protein OsmY
MIYDALDADPLIPFDANIDVTVEAGTVYLRGEVPSKRIKHAAGDDAWWIPGVVDVHNEIKVTPRRPRGGEAGQAKEQQAQQGE